MSSIFTYIRNVINNNVYICSLLALTMVVNECDSSKVHDKKNKKNNNYSSWAVKGKRNQVEMFLHEADVTVDCFVERRQSENSRQCDFDAEELFNTLLFFLQRTWCCNFLRAEFQFQRRLTAVIWLLFFFRQGCDVVTHERAKIRVQLSYSERLDTTQIPLWMQVDDKPKFFLETLSSARVKRSEYWPAEYSHCGSTRLRASSSCSEWVMCHLWVDLQPLRNNSFQARTSWECSGVAS